MNGIIKNCIVKEILSCQYNGEQFEDYYRVNLPYGKLAETLYPFSLNFEIQLCKILEDTKPISRVTELINSLLIKK